MRVLGLPLLGRGTRQHRRLKASPRPRAAVCEPEPQHDGLAPDGDLVAVGQGMSLEREAEARQAMPLYPAQSVAPCSRARAEEPSTREELGAHGQRTRSKMKVHREE